jgi:hypothetical protein
MRKIILFGISLCALGLNMPAHSAVIYATNFSELSSAIQAANLESGSTIYLAPGTYSGGELPNILTSLTISLDPASGSAAGAAILNTIPTSSKGLLTVPSGVSDVALSVNGLTFKNAIISDADGGNGAGIRFQSSGPSSLIVTNSTFLDNQDGILTGFGAPLADELLIVSISNSLFANNGSGTGFTHGIYIFGKSLEVSNSIFCGTIAGHDIKSRAAVTTISDSSFYDGTTVPNALCNIGSASYSIDIPNGGEGTITGNEFIQGAASENPAIVSYGEEGLAFQDNSLIVRANTFESTIRGTGIQELSYMSRASAVIKQHFQCNLGSCFSGGLHSSCSRP